jgi:aryl-alcohol dehydrogenase-like predicted oxidoreductase
MKYRQLGATGTRVSVLCLGAMTFGEADEKSFMHKVSSSEQESQAVMDRAVEAGVNFIDTADVYGQDGLSERVLGRWMKERKNRDRIVLATKGRFRMSGGPNGAGVSRMRIQRAIEASLTRLGTDRIDLYQIHMQDLHTPEEELMRALDDAVHAGKIVYFGASNYTAYRLMESLWISDKRGLNRYVTLQAQYSLASRVLEREHTPLCTKFGLGILPWSPLASGLLSGKYRRGQAAPAGSRLAQWKDRYSEFDSERNWKIVDTLVAVAAELGKAPSQVALAWLVSRPVVSSVIFGARTVAQLEENLGAGDLILPAEIVTRLDAASAPELGYPYEFIKNVDGAW